MHKNDCLSIERDEIVQSMENTIRDYNKLIAYYSKLGAKTVAGATTLVDECAFVQASTPSSSSSSSSSSWFKTTSTTTTSLSSSVVNSPLHLEFSSLPLPRTTSSVFEEDGHDCDDVIKGQANRLVGASKSFNFSFI